MKPISGYEGLYSVTMSGFIYSHKNKGYLKPLYDEHGYVQFSLYKDSKMKTLKVHKLVAETFIDNPGNKPCVNHIDGNKYNNNALNLEWCTYSENNKHSFSIGLQTNVGEQNPNAKLKDNDIIEIKELINKGLKNIEISKIFGVSSDLISKIKTGKCWRHVK